MHAKPDCSSSQILAEVRFHRSHPGPEVVTLGFSRNPGMGLQRPRVNLLMGSCGMLVCRGRCFKFVGLWYVLGGRAVSNWKLSILITHL